MFPQGDKGDRGWRGLYGDNGAPGMIKVNNVKYKVGGLSKN